MLACRRQVPLVLLATALALAAIAPGAAARDAKGGGEPTVCGSPPGENPGAYSYIRAWNTSCKRARKVAPKAYERFCDPVRRCIFDPNSGDRVRGSVGYRGWDCGLRLAYEFVRIGCEKGSRRFVHEAGA